MSEKWNVDLIKHLINSNIRKTRLNPIDKEYHTDLTENL